MTQTARNLPGAPRCKPQEDVLAELRAENKMLGKIIKELQADLKDKDQMIKAKSPTGPARGLALKVQALEKELKRRTQIFSQREAELLKVRKELEDALLDMRDEMAVLQSRLQEKEEATKELLLQEKHSPASCKAGQHGVLQGGGEEVGSGRQDHEIQLHKAEERLQRSLDELRLERGFWKAKRAEWDHTKQDLGLQIEALQRRNQELQRALTEAKVAAQEAESESLEARAEARGAAASLATLGEAESVVRSHGAEALTKVERLRRDLVEATEHAEATCMRAISLGAEGSEAVAHAMRSERALQASRAELQRLREELLAAKSVTTGQLLEMSRSAAVSRIASDTGEDGIVQNYICVLEHALREAEESLEAMRAAAQGAHEQEAVAREHLLASREAESRMASALQAELKRVRRLEVLRLSDVQELHDMEARLGLISKETHFLRDSLAAERFRYAKFQVITGECAIEKGPQSYIDAQWKENAMEREPSHGFQRMASGPLAVIDTAEKRDIMDNSIRKGTNVDTLQENLSPDVEKGVRSHSGIGFNLPKCLAPVPDKGLACAEATEEEHDDGTSEGALRRARMMVLRWSRPS